MQMFEGAKKDKKIFLAFKNLAVKCQQFELAVKIRELETELFPESDEEKQAKEIAKEINLVFRMVDLKVSEDVCWLIYEALKLHSEVKGSFSVEDAAKLIAKKKTLFDD